MTPITPPQIHPPFANYAHGIVVPAGMRLLVLSGQLGIAADASVPKDAEGQADLCFANIAAVLAAAGAGPEAVVRLNAYVSGRQHLAGYMVARDRFVSNPAPASTLMSVTGLARDESVLEVEALAALPG